jgi:uncharacterized protein (TIGR03437 family)
MAKNGGMKPNWVAAKNLRGKRSAHAVVLFVFSSGIAVSQQPTIRQQPPGVANSASYSTTNPPGSLVVIFGTNMYSKAGKVLIASSTPLSMKLQDSTDTVSATVNGLPAPIYYTTTTQMSIQLPWKTDSGTGNATVVVTRNGSASSPYQFTVGRFSPGIFTINQQGTGAAWVINNNDGSVAQPAAGWPFKTIVPKPATAGDNLYIYATGLGPISPALTDGAASCPLSGCPSGVVLSKTTTLPTILINGTAIPADHLQFSGGAPKYVGVYQVNFKMPAGVSASGSTTLQLQIGGVLSNQVTFATQ